MVPPCGCGGVGPASFVRLAALLSSHALLRAVFAAKPDRTTTNEIADHNSVAMSFPDGDLINADCLWTRGAGTLELGFHILLIERLDRMLVQLQFRRRHLLDRRSPT